MKKIAIFFVCIVAAALSSCDDYLDINDNPNQAVVASPRLVLPQALAATALVLNSYNTYGMQIGGYAANAGGYGGFNETVSYAYTPGNYAGNWSVSYDNLNDYEYIINQTEGVEADLKYNAVAKIMKAYGFELLVDTYNDVPYTEALKGSNDISPAYDAAEDTYVKLAELLDDAMAEIETVMTLPVSNDITAVDILFKGNMTQWLKLANTIKLRLLLKGSGKVTFTNTTLNAAGFLTDDALINPGYTRDANRQNPAWNTWGFSSTGTSGAKSWIPTTWMLTFYNGTKISDPARGAVVYYQYPSTGTNQLGYEATGIPASPNGTFWYSGTDRVGTTAGNSRGVLKGPNAGYPMFTAAESYFLQAEAVLDGMTLPTAGTDQAFFEAGIRASFKYLYMLPDGTFSGNHLADANAYIAANTANYLVNYAVAGSDADRLEAIITQKYIALNMVNSHEGWNEYRRTGYPSVSGTSATTTFASIASQSTADDRLPTRIQYPTSEFLYNSANVPGDVNVFSSTIFWAQ